MTTAPKAGARTRLSLIALAGAATAAIVTPFVAGWEGERLVAYQDVARVWTICNGDTSDVKPGQRATPAECRERLERQLVAHAGPVLSCTPGLRDRPPQLSAAISLAYNIGTGAYCRSTVARRFNAGPGSWRFACDGFLAWRYAGGREVAGLLNRRRAERALCLRALPA